MKKGVYVFSFFLFSLLFSLFWYLWATENPFVSNSPFVQDRCISLSLPHGSYLVTKVVDGDTFLVEGGRTIRILGIDADEKGYPCYESAKQKLESKILGKVVELVSLGQDKDRYCRFLRQVKTEKDDIALYLLREGEVVARTGISSEYDRLLEIAEREAREKKKGCKWQKSSLPEIEACQALSFIGKETWVKGRVVSTKKTSKVIFLNLEKPYPDQCFTVVIFSSAWKNFDFSPERYYLGKKIRVRGIVKLYKDKPEIVLYNPQDIQLLSF